MLRPGGLLWTQQVGAENDAELNAAFGARPGVFADTVPSPTPPVTGAAVGGRAIGSARSGGLGA